MIARKRLLTLVICLLIGLLTIAVWLQKRAGCSVGYWMNPDMVCRVLDIKDGKYLIEYFNSDTNEIRLYIQQNGKDLLIEHPYSKVKSYKEAINQNIIKFNPNDEGTLLVNGEIFPINPKD